MARCEQCGNDYDKSFEVTMGGRTTLSDIELASRIAERDVAAVRLVTGRNNQRLYRTAWTCAYRTCTAKSARNTERINSLSSRARS
jgi:hypothetical protein